jgi:hypothetical protein
MDGLLPRMGDGNIKCARICLQQADLLHESAGIAWLTDAQRSVMLRRAHAENRNAERWVFQKRLS